MERGCQDRWRERRGSSDQLFSPGQLITSLPPHRAAAPRSRPSSSPRIRYQLPIARTPKLNHLLNHESDGDRILITASPLQESSHHLIIRKSPESLQDTDDRNKSRDKIIYQSYCTANEWK